MVDNPTNTYEKKTQKQTHGASSPRSHAGVNAPRPA
jgi:hypothetical protein